MLEGFYTAASGVLMEERNFSVLANNLANVNTAGFRASRVTSESFQQTYLTILENGQYRKIGVGDPSRIVRDVVTDFDPALLQETGRSLDIAINGEGYFAIQTGTQEEEGSVYLTRNGSFALDEEGYLVLPEQGRVLGENGPIQVKNARFTVTPEGMIFNEKGKMIDRLLIQLPSAPAEGAEALAEDMAKQPLDKMENGMYRMGEGVVLTRVDTPLRQNVLERSNVDLNREYTQVMTAQRTFQSCSAALKAIDRINEKTASRIGSVQ